MKARAYDLDKLYPPDRPTWPAEGQSREEAAWVATQGILLTIGVAAIGVALALAPAGLFAIGAGAACIAWVALYKLLRRCGK